MPQLKTQVNLQAYNTFGIEAYARYWMEIQHEEEAREFLMDNAAQKIPVSILGGGSNILFTQNVENVVLYNRILGIEKLEENETEVKVRIGAGECWHDCVLHCLDQNWGGIENLSLIPGTVGAAPIQNIGAYGVEIKDSFFELEAMHLQTGQMRKFNKAECEFGYRDSVFKRKYKQKFLITRVTLRLSKAPVLNTSYGAIETELAKTGGKIGIREVSNAVIRIRQRKLPDPKQIGNAGSFFKNPHISQAVFDKLRVRYPDIPHYPLDEGVKIPAAWLIEQCGWKGKRIGNYGVHKNQALVLVNYGGANGKDIYELSKQIRKSVEDRFEISLTREVQIL